MREEAILFIGQAPPDRAADYLPWSTIAEQPLSLIHYSRIVVVPEPSVPELQQQLLDVLKKQSTLTEIEMMVIWILNEYCLPNITDQLTLGTLVPLNPGAEGVIEASVPNLKIQTHDVAFAIGDCPPEAMRLASWRRSSKEGAITIGVLSSDGRWMLVPPVEETLTYIQPRSKVGFLPQASLIAVAVVLLMLSTVIVVHDYRLQRQFARTAKRILVVGRLPAPNTGGGLSSYWLSAEERLTSRLLISRSSVIPTIAKQLVSDESPEAIWASKGRSAAQARAYFDLALITGDLPAAYDIVRENRYRDDRKEWLVHLTDTVWQTAVEATHELDFERARIYTDMYLAMSDHVLNGVSTMSELGPERNRTLAQILQRELRSGRILSLCKDAGVKNSFGRLLGGDAGYSLPAESPSGLEVRRTENRNKFCGGPLPSPLVQYSALEALEQLARGQAAGGNDPTTYGNEEESRACVIAPLECEFISARDRLNPPVSTQDATQALDWAASCSYLSDDLMYILLAVPPPPDTGDEVSQQQGSAAQKINRGAIDSVKLRAALRCVDRGTSDYRLLVEQRLDAASCSSFKWTNRHVKVEDIPSDELSFRTLIARCRA